MGAIRCNDDRWVTVRPACEADLNDIATMIDDFVSGHPAEHQPRPLGALRAAYFGEAPVAHLLVACKMGRIVGMGQWTLIYDMFWAMFGGNAEWLYVRPEARGRGIAAAIAAEICSQIRDAGGEFLHGGGDDEVSQFYERVAIGTPTNACHVSGEAFQVFADLAGASPRELARCLPSRDLNKVPARPRSPK
jgi:GNAT superfamily N-acetyltransferase